MVEVVLVTEPEYNKGAQAFLAADDLQCVPVSSEESDLAEAVRRYAARGVIVGVRQYGGPLYEALGQQAPAIVARFGVGYNNIDVALAQRCGIVVTNTPGALDTSVAEHAFWLIGATTRHVCALHASMQSGEFVPQAGQELRGRTLVVLGMGRIGREVARIAQFGFGMHVIGVDSKSIEEFQQREKVRANQLHEVFGLDEYTCDVESAMRRADVLTIHLPAQADTRLFLSAERLAWLPSTALLVNTSRGSIVDEVALYDALSSGRLAAAGLDVFQHEPYEPVDSLKDLRRLPNVVLTPHVGSNTKAANRRMAEICLKNVRMLFSGADYGLDRIEALEV